MKPIYVKFETGSIWSWSFALRASFILFSTGSSCAAKEKSGKGASPLASKAFLRPSLRTFVTFWFLAGKKGTRRKGTVVMMLDMLFTCSFCTLTNRTSTFICQSICFNAGLVCVCAAGAGKLRLKFQ